MKPKCGDVYEWGGNTYVCVMPVGHQDIGGEIGSRCMTWGDDLSRKKIVHWETNKSGDRYWTDDNPRSGRITPKHEIVDRFVRVLHDQTSTMSAGPATRGRKRSPAAYLIAGD